MPCLRLPAFPCRKTPQPPREDAPVERDGIGLNLSALERNQTADCSAGYPARPERRTALFHPQKKKTGTALDEPSPLPSVQPQGVSGITAPPAQPRIPSRRRSSRQGRMPCLGLPAFPCRKTPQPPKEDTPVERGGIGLNLSALERSQTADCSAGYPARPERRTALFRPPQKKENGNGTCWAAPVAVCTASTGHSRHHRPACSAANTVSETLLPSREDAMLGIPAFPCRKTPQPPREDAPVERRRHWPEPQRLGTEPDGGLLGRLSGTPRAADSPLPTPQKENGNGT